MGDTNNYVHPPMISDPQPATKVPFDEETIRRRINSCPRLASLQVNNRALRDLVNSEQSVTSQIAAIIRRELSAADCHG